MKPLLRNIPNLLSASRLVAFPFLLWLIVAGNKQAFVVLLSVCLITDILDGLIARIFKLQTEFGAKLDSVADITMYIAAFFGIYKLHHAFFVSKKLEFIALAVLWMLPYVICLLRFRRLPHFHLYSTKIAGYLQGIFIFTFFNWGNADWYFYTMYGFSALAFTEELVVVCAVPELRPNVKGIFWMMKEKGRIA